MFLLRIKNGTMEVILFYSKKLLSFTVLFSLLISGCRTEKNRLTIFCAPAYLPVLEAVTNEAETGLGLDLITEASGSQDACRKVTELGRKADILMLADSLLFSALLKNTCSFHIDIANDEVVLGVGTLAKYTDRAENDWTDVLLRKDVRIGRVDENLGPIGYRTLLVWKLQQNKENPGLYEKLLTKTERTVDHVTQLTALLKAGDVDYGFVYRSICIGQDIRYIQLDPEVNLGSAEYDYSSARVTFNKMKSGTQKNITVIGAPITFGVTIPDEVLHSKSDAIRFLKFLIHEKRKLFTRKGFTAIQPSFYGRKEDFKPFKKYAVYKGKA